MGLLDRMKAALGDHGGEEPVAPPVDEPARREQLDTLERSLRELARSMAGDASQELNPGWRGRISDLRFAADEAARLSKEGFDRAALQDLAAIVRPLYPSGAPVPEEYAPYRAKHDRVLAAVEALRAPLPSESGPAGSA